MKKLGNMNVWDLFIQILLEMSDKKCVTSIKSGKMASEAYKTQSILCVEMSNCGSIVKQVPFLQTFF